MGSDNFPVIVMLIVHTNHIVLASLDVLAISYFRLYAETSDSVQPYFTQVSYNIQRKSICSQLALSQTSSCWTENIKYVYSK